MEKTIEHRTINLIDDFYLKELEQILNIPNSNLDYTGIKKKVKIKKAQYEQLMMLIRLNTMTRQLFNKVSSTMRLNEQWLKQIVDNSFDFEHID